MAYGSGRTGGSGSNTGASSIGRLDPDAADPEDTIQTFGGPPEVDEPFDIKGGPDGWLWFTDKAANALGRIFAGLPERL
jgi:streptogramin lyase